MYMYSIGILRFRFMYVHVQYRHTEAYDDHVTIDTGGS